MPHPHPDAAPNQTLIYPRLTVLRPRFPFFLIFRLSGPLASHRVPIYTELAPVEPHPGPPPPGSPGGFRAVGRAKPFPAAILPKVPSFQWFSLDILRFDARLSVRRNLHNLSIFRNQFWAERAKLADLVKMCIFGRYQFQLLSHTSKLWNPFSGIHLLKVESCTRLFNDALMFLTPVIYRLPQLMESGFDLKRPNTAGIGFRWGKALTQKCPQKRLLKYFCSIYASLPHPSSKLKGRPIIATTSTWGGGISKSIVTNLGEV